jgi:hypothetical protein
VSVSFPSYGQPTMRKRRKPSGSFVRNRTVFLVEGCSGAAHVSCRAGSSLKSGVGPGLRNPVSQLDLDRPGCPITRPPAALLPDQGVVGKLQIPILPAARHSWQTITLIRSQCRHP